MQSTWLEINRDALLQNVAGMKAKLPKKILFNAVVKANAYGHGLLEVVEAVKEEVDYFSVYAFEDALMLRQKGVTNGILVLGRIFPAQIQQAIDSDIEVSVSSFDILHAADERLKMHICVDTGMGRDGFVDADRQEVLRLLRQKKYNVKGLYMHFASADESAFDAYTQKQVDGLMEWKDALAAMGVKPLLHKGASCSIFLPDAEQFDMVRAGISLYGLWPSLEMKERHQKTLQLTPALVWKARIVELKSLPKGSAISYGCSHILQRDARIAILPIGYFDGIFRVSSNLGKVVVNGVKVPQIGKVTMNMIILDVSELADVQVGDVATIIGEGNDADDWGKISQTSSYEIVTRINPAIQRIVI